MVLQTYYPKDHRGGCVVTITQDAFNFSALASRVANLGDVNWVRLHTDSDDRLVVFELVLGRDKIDGVLKLGTHSRNYKKVIAKGLIRNTPWINKFVQTPVSLRKFELKKYDGELPSLNVANQVPRVSWYIQLAPVFEKSISASEINQLDSSVKGIYRYRGGNDGKEIIYIGKGSIKDRFIQDPSRRNWGVIRIEYSILKDDQEAYLWEAKWIERFKEENNGNLPRYNRQNGHG